MIVVIISHYCLSFPYPLSLQQAAENGHGVTIADIEMKYGKNWSKVKWEDGTPRKKQKTATTPKSAKADVKELDVKELDVKELDVKELMEKADDAISRLCDVIMQQTDEIKDLKAQLAAGGANELKELKQKIAELVE